ncbi:receptor-like protein 7 [Tanacetum coccineum]
MYTIFFGLNTIYVTSKCFSDERSALLALKSELVYNASVSTTLAGWNQSVACCDWGGVTCDEAGHVIELDLLNDNISGGTLSDSIDSLKMLSRLELRGCGLTGPIPASAQNLTRLEYLSLSNNRFTGSVPSFKLSKKLAWVDLYQNNLTGTVSSSQWEGLNSLEHLDMSSNSLSGPIPEFIFKLPLILDVKLSWNNFNGSVDLDMFGTLKELMILDLSYNDLTVNVKANGSFLSLSNLDTLKLASCKMLVLSDLKNQSGLTTLDLSDNELVGEIPNWIWEVGNEYLRFLNLSHNKFSSLQKPYTIPSRLETLDLHSNNLQGDIPIPSRGSYIIDYSNNNFGSSIPFDVGNFLSSAVFFSISNSTLVGPLPQSLCNASNLLILDLSRNSLNGKVPVCLIERSKTLRVLNLRRNNLSGNITDVFPDTCELKTLDISGNLMRGILPVSLVKCISLEVLDLGYNSISDTFPCWASNFSNLHVFVIRSNNFYGNIGCLGTNGNWTNLQILDIASNKFSGVIPSKLFTSFQAIMDNHQSTSKYLHFVHSANSAIYYQDSATVVFKGTIRDVEKILNIFTSIDLSNNTFQGSIPVAVGDLKLLELLNISHNALTGPIPTSIGKLDNLESLDLSVNKLSGSIPMQLASVPFLSFLNLSYNQLSGRIPQGPQFQTFTDLSFKGNQGLCDIPLNTTCDNPTSGVPTQSPEANEDSDYKTDLYASIGLGFLVGLAIIVGPLVYSRRLRTWYSNHVDRILLING